MPRPPPNWAPRLTLVSQSAKGIYLDSKVPWHGKPLFFAAVREGKSYVSFHFFPIYMFPELKKTLSPELAKRMQGKACFNFSTPEPALLRELAALTKTGFDRFQREKLV